MNIYKKPTTRTIVLCEEYALMDTSNPSSSVDPNPDHNANGEEAMTNRNSSIWDYWTE